MKASLAVRIILVGFGTLLFANHGFPNPSVPTFRARYFAFRGLHNYDFIKPIWMNKQGDVLVQCRRNYSKKKAYWVSVVVSGSKNTIIDSPLPPANINNTDSVIFNTNNSYSMSGINTIQPEVFTFTGLQRLKMARGDVSEYVSGINNNGIIVGVGYTRSGIFHPIIWNSFQASPLVLSYYDAYATAVDDKGGVIILVAPPLVSARPQYSLLPFIYGHGNIIRPWSIKDLRAFSQSRLYYASFRVSSAGDILVDVSYTSSPVFGYKSFAWRNGLIETLPQQVDALAINANGDVVGNSTREYAGGANPIIWHNGRLFNLRKLIVNGNRLPIGDAVCINDAGSILCETKSSIQRGYVILTPVPYQR
jgi:hypothetical protein